MRNKTLAVAAFFLGFFLSGCSSSKYAMTPSVEFKKAASKAHYNTFLNTLLSERSAFLNSLLKDNDKFHIKIIYTQIDRQSNNKPRFTNYYFNIDPGQYFYPASTVKMPVSFLALQRLNELKNKGVDKNTTMITEAAYEGQTPVYNDPTSEDGRPTIAHYIKKIFLVSDNDAFNRLYEFLGQEYINDQLHQKGYDTAQIIHRLEVSMNEDQHRHTNPVKFYDTSSKIIYEQPLIKSDLVYQPRNTFLGNGYYSKGNLINKPFDFSKKNRLTLVDLHSVLMSVIFPKAVDKSQRFKLKKEDYDFLHRYMSMMPKESTYPQYDSSYSDACVKFLLYGGKGLISDPGIRIFNKVGDAYGFLTDAAYIVDFKNNIEFFLSATIYCNSDGIFNDDKYDYDTIGYPFMKELGKLIYDYELQRQRKRLPHLSNFKMSYTK